MNKIYIKPAMQVNETQVLNLMAVSLNINSSVEVDGGEALSREDEWSVWED